jgi:hypothetical protein
MGLGFATCDFFHGASRLGYENLKWLTMLSSPRETGVWDITGLLGTRI